MNYIQLKEWLESLINNPEIQSINIKDWKEMGEFDGDQPMPIVKITKIEQEA